MKYMILIHSDMAVLAGEPLRGGGQPRPWQSLQGDQRDQGERRADPGRGPRQRAHVHRVPERHPGRDRRAVRRGQGAARRAVPRSTSTASTVPRRSPDRCRSTASSRSGRSWRMPGRRCDRADPTRGRAPDRSGTSDRDIEGLLRELAPQVLAALARRNSQFDAAEDAVQEALLTASRQWPDAGVPDNPRGWLITVAQRRLHRPAPIGCRTTAARVRRRGPPPARGVAHRGAGYR